MLKLGLFVVAASVSKKAYEREHVDSRIPYATVHQCRRCSRQTERRKRPILTKEFNCLDDTEGYPRLERAKASSTLYSTSAIVS
jgi:hypothetical protein